MFALPLSMTDLGGTPFIAPNSNTTGEAGELFRKMFHFYLYRRDEFLQRYHKRSRIETTFSAVKRKFGSHVRSRDKSASSTKRCASSSASI